MRGRDAKPPAVLASEIHVEKTRHGAAPPPLRVAALEPIPCRAAWRWGPAAGRRFERAAALINHGLTALEAAAALGISRTSLFRLKAEARAKATC